MKSFRWYFIPSSHTLCHMHLRTLTLCSLVKVDNLGGGRRQVGSWGGGEKVTQVFHAYARDEEWQLLVNAKKRKKRKKGPNALRSQPWRVKVQAEFTVLTKDMAGRSKTSTMRHNKACKTYKERFPHLASPRIKDVGMGGAREVFSEWGGSF